MRKFLFCLCTFLVLGLSSCPHKNENKEIIPDQESKEAKLVKLDINGDIKENLNPKETQIFYVAENQTEVSIVAETEPKNAKIVFAPELENGKLKLTSKETKLSITVGDKKKTEYNVVIQKYESLKNLIDIMFIYGGKQKGIISSPSNEDVEKILNGEDVIVEVAGPKVQLIVASKNVTWTKFRVQGKDELFAPVPFYHFTSAGSTFVDLGKKGETTEVLVEVQSSEKITFGKLKIKRKEELVDVPVESLLIGGEDVIEDSKMLQKLTKTPKPEFDGSEPSLIEVRADENVMQEVKVDGSPADILTKKVGESDVWYAQKEIQGVSPSGKDVVVEIEPINKEDYQSIKWEFKLNYKPKQKITFDYEFNGVQHYRLPAEFKRAFEKDQNPILTVAHNYLNISLKTGAELEYAMINDEKIEGANIVETSTGYVINHSIPIGTSEEQITITLEPVAKGKYFTRQAKFRVIGTDIKAKLQPVLKINDYKDFNKMEFLDKLSDGSKPLQKIAKEDATIEIILSDYEYKFFSNKVKINNEECKLERGLQGSVTWVYRGKKDFHLSKTDATEIKIEFIAKNEAIAEGLVWQFKLQAGGEKPPIPEDKVQIIRINGVGREGGDKLPKDFVDHLTDGTKPHYSITGKKAKIEVQWTGDEYPKNINKVSNKVVFTLFNEDGSQELEKQEVTSRKVDNILHGVEHTFNFNDTNKYFIKIEIMPIKEDEYSSLIYSFMLSDSGLLPEIPCKAGFAGKIAKSGISKTLNSEWTEFFVQADDDVMQSVTIDGEESTVKEAIDTGGTKFYHAKKICELPFDNEKNFTIKVIPKDTSTYRETEFTYTLKGKKVADNNAEFVNKGTSTTFKPKVSNHIEWKAGITPPEYINEYGAIATTLTAYTVSSRSKVKYKKINPINDSDIIGEAEHEMTNTHGMHTARIEFFPFKPTKIKVWVIAPDGNTTHKKKGEYSYTYNPTPLRFDYATHTVGGSFPKDNISYDTIEIDTNKVVANKLYVVFCPWPEKDGYTIDNSALPPHQQAFTKLDATKSRQWWQTIIDVKDVIDNNNTLEIQCPIKKDGVECFTYKVTIKKKS